MAGTFAVRAAETCDRRKTSLEFFRYPAFLLFIIGEAVYFDYLSFFQQIVDMPVRFFIAAQVPQDARFDAIHGRARIGVVAPTEAQTT